jgi:hypothetical protein
VDRDINTAIFCNKTSELNGLSLCFKQIPFAVALYTPSFPIRHSLGIRFIGLIPDLDVNLIDRIFLRFFRKRFFNGLFSLFGF